jgi:primosomal protein N'
MSGLLELLEKRELAPRAHPRDGGNVARCPRCSGWVHSSNGYLCKTCKPRKVVVRACDGCGGRVTSHARFLCAACHFRGWWGEWA